MVDNEVVEMTAREEGFDPRPYRDSKDFWTIGHGYLISYDKRITYEEAVSLAGNVPWSRELADEKLRLRLREAQDDIDRLMPWHHGLPERTQKALVMMCYQLGINKLLGFKEMVKALMKGDLMKAQEEALDSVWAREDSPARALRTATMLGNR